MSGHSKWSQIKRKKAVTDQKRAKQFTKLLSLISAAAKTEPNPDFNPRLRTAVEKAKEASVPQENIERAIKKAKDDLTEEVIIEAYGPEGTAFIIKALTNNKNRTVPEVKKLLSDLGAKFAEQGSVRWSFTVDQEGEWEPTFMQPISKEAREKVLEIMESLDDNEDISDIYTNAFLGEENDNQ